MIFIYKPYSILFIAGAALSLILSLIIWRRRPAPGASAFALFNLAAGVWALFWMLELGSVDIGAKILWAKIEYLGILASGPLWLIFAMQFSGSNWWAKKSNLVLLFIFPLITLSLACTNEIHGWVWSQVYYISQSFGRVTIWEHGFWFWLNAGFQYVMVSIGVVYLWRYKARISRLYRQQVIALTVGAVIPILVNVIYVIKIPEIEGLDFTPFSIALSSIIYVLAIFRYHLLDVNSIARNTLIEKAPDGIMVLDINANITDINPATESLLHLKKADTLGKHLGKVWPSLNPVKKRLNAEKHIEMEAAENGTEYALDISLTEIVDKKNVTNGYLMVLRDISRRLKAEKTLKESEKRYSTLVEQSNDGVLIVKAGEIKFTNQTFVNICGYSREELVGQSTLLVIEESDAYILRDLNTLRLENKPIPESIEVKLKRKDGQVRNADVGLGIIAYEGEPVTIVTIRDITEKKVTQKKLEMLYNEEKELRQNLQEETENRSKYTRALVHELKTPLTAILSSSELLIDVANSDKTLLSVAQNIHKASLNLEHRTDELIDLAQGEIGMLKVVMEPIDFRQLVKGIQREMKAIALAKGLELVCETEKVPLIMGDSQKLKLVIVNLLNNAIKYSNQGSIIIRAMDHDGKDLLVQVKDSGVGIDAEQMRNLFDPYRRKILGGLKYSGMGVGLALCRIYIELHKGKIWVESEQGKGTTVFFTLPVYTENQTDSENSIEPIRQAKIDSHC
jgi:PAS domain S-box-containing protein